MSLPQTELKKKLIEKLKDNPIVSSACIQLGISRATYYRWIEGDKKFKNKVRASLRMGREAICDLAESKVVSMVKSGNENIALGAAKYILNNNSSRYRQTNSYSTERRLLREQVNTTKKEDTDKIEKTLTMLSEFMKRNREQDKKNEG